uniref:Uncharacterized protein n=1 Tax=Lotharella globosa TaxID=91324 RepID=A0A7S3YKK1_9EUKA
MIAAERQEATTQPSRLVSSPSSRKDERGAGSQPTVASSTSSTPLLPRETKWRGKKPDWLNRALAKKRRSVEKKKKGGGAARRRVSEGRRAAAAASTSSNGTSSVLSSKSCQDPHQKKVAREKRKTTGIGGKRRRDGSGSHGSGGAEPATNQRHFPTTKKKKPEPSPARTGAPAETSPPTPTSAPSPSPSVPVQGRSGSAASLNGSATGTDPSSTSVSLSSPVRARNEDTKAFVHGTSAKERNNDGSHAAAAASLRKRGRPPKSPKERKTPVSPPKKRGRGRPRRLDRVTSSAQKLGHGDILSVTWTDEGTFECRLHITAKGKMYVQSNTGEFEGLIPFDAELDKWKRIAVPESNISRPARPVAPKHKPRPAGAGADAGTKNRPSATGRSPSRSVRREKRSGGGKGAKSNGGRQKSGKGGSGGSSGGEMAYKAKQKLFQDIHHVLILMMYVL